MRCAIAFARLLCELAQLVESNPEVLDGTPVRRVPAAGFAELLKRHRRRAGLTQEELAERAALSTRTISELERGAAHARRRDTVVLLSEALELSREEQEHLEASISRRRGPRPRSTIRAFASLASA